MRKITFWINTGFANCNYEDTFEYEDNTPDELIEEDFKIYLTDNIDFGWCEENKEN